MPNTKIKPLYDALVTKSVANVPKDLKGDETTDRLVNLVLGSRAFLATIDRAPLISNVPGKTYFMFSDSIGNKTSRPVNASLYLNNLSEVRLRALLSCETAGVSSEELTRIAYTAAMSYACAADILNMRDQKTPGTFFEILIGHIVARALGVNPEKQIKVPTLDMKVTIPTDYVFDLGAAKNRVHLPIKTSTRERVVQVWAHQRVLDGMHGMGRFKGVLVAMTETNKRKNTSVVEICLPNQWVAYQMYIAQMFRVYYLDLPQPYVALKDRYPFIQVKHFGDFFSELAKIQVSGVDA